MSESELLLSLSREGVCAPGLRWLGGRSQDFATLVHVWRRWPEYLYEHYDYAIGLLRGMGAAFISRLASERLFVDYSCELELGSVAEPIFLLGDSSVSFRFVPYSVCKIYCFGRSSVKIYGDSSCRIDIELFGRSDIAEVKGCVPLVWNYGEGAVPGFCDVRVCSYERGSVFNGVEVPDADEGTW